MVGILTFVILAIGSLLTYRNSRSYKEEGGSYVSTFFPKAFTLDNYIKLFHDTTLLNFPKMFMNTLIVAIFSCLPSTFLLLSVSYFRRRRGAHLHPHRPAVTYLSCHDDWTLWDKLVLTMDPLRRFDRLDPELLRANRLAAAICFTCQGRLFLLSGEEFARTKQGVRDSVRSPLEINRLDWRRAWENRELADYYRGLIALRKTCPVFREGSFTLLDPENEKVFSYTRDTAEEHLLVVCSFTAEEQPEVLPNAFQEAEVLLANYPDPSGTLRPYETRMYYVK